MAYDLFNLRRFQKGSDDAVPMNASHPPDSQSTRRASSGSRFPAGLTGLLGGNFSFPNPPSNGATSLSVHMGASRVLTGIAILATLILGLWLLLPGGALRAQETGTFEYAEKGTGPVATFTASDPEDATPIVWTLLASDDGGVQDIPGEGEDGADNVGSNRRRSRPSLPSRSARDGVLEFKAKPNFEGTPGTTSIM